MNIVNLGNRPKQQQQLVAELQFQTLGMRPISCLRACEVEHWMTLQFSPPVPFPVDAPIREFLPLFYIWQLMEVKFV